MKRAFTLIELLVVMAIIGMLAAFIIAQISGAVKRGQDAKIRSQLSSIKVQAEMYYDANDTFYVSDKDNSCLDPKVIKFKTFGSEVADCNVNPDGSSWAASMGLKSESGFFCVDSTSAATTTTTDIGTAYLCPGSL